MKTPSPIGRLDDPQLLQMMSLKASSVAEAVRHHHPLPAQYHRPYMCFLQRRSRCWHTLLVFRRILIFTVKDLLTLGEEIGSDVTIGEKPTVACETTDDMSVAVSLTFSAL